MLFKKKSGAPSAPASKPTGLFIDPETRAAEEGDQVIDVPVVDVSDATTAAPTLAAEPRAASSFAALRVKKTGSAAASAATAPQAQAKPTAAKSSLSGLRARFGSKTPVASSAEAAGTPASTEKQVAAEKTKKPEKVKKPAAQKPTKFTGKAEKRVTLLTELDNGRQLYWTIEADKVSQTEEAPQGVAFSFSKEDFRFRAEGALTYRQANDLALQEVGEAVQVVNRSKDLRAVYATRQERALEAKHMLVPAQQALDRLLAERKKDAQPLICGFHLKDASDEASVAVLFHVAADGEASKPQISVNPDSMEFVIAQFSASRKVDKNTTEVVLFDNAEFLAALAGATPFPNEPVWRGVPVRQVLSMAALCAMAVSLGLGGWAGYQFQQVAALKATQARLQQEMSSTKKQMSALISGSVPQFAQAMSIDVPVAMTRAQQLWVPETRMTMVADLSSTKYEMSMPVARTATFNNRPTAVDPITPELHQKLLNYTAPEGCTRNPIGATGALNETQLTITCETGNPALAHYRND